MSLFAPLFRNSLEDPQTPISSDRIMEVIGGDRTHSGVSVTEKKALGIPAVWRAVALIAGTSASLPLHAYRSAGAVRQQVSSGNAAALLEAPQEDMTQYEWTELLYVHLLTWGNAYFVKVPRAGGRGVQQLLGVHPSRVKPGRTAKGVKVYQIDDKEGYTDREILHIPGLSHDGVAGMSPIRTARQSLALALAAEEFGAKLFANGSLSTGILTTDARLNAEQADALHARWKQRRSGLDKSGETIVLDGGLKYSQLTIPPEDAQFLQTRSFQISEIARMFGVPPHMLMDTEKSTSWGSGIEQQGIGFLMFTLRPWLTRVEQRLTRILEPEAVYARFTVEGLLRADSAGRSAFYREMWSLGVFSTNDILALEERPAVPGGDVRYRPLNMGVLGTTNEEELSDA